MGPRFYSDLSAAWSTIEPLPTQYGEPTALFKKRRGTTSVLCSTAILDTQITRIPAVEERLSENAAVWPVIITFKISPGFYAPKRAHLFLQRILSFITLPSWRSQHIHRHTHTSLTLLFLSSPQKYIPYWDLKKHNNNNNKMTADISPKHFGFIIIIFLGETHLDSFIINEWVNCLRSSLVVCFIHSGTELCSG